ncbi:MAG: Hint domain-containing protein [Cognatishimia sp.]
MPVFYIYSRKDFRGGLPKETWGTAKGKGTVELRLKPGAEPTRVEISDDDAVFHELDSSQVLAHDIDLDGKEYAAGTTVQAAYDLTNTSTGHRVTSLHLGGDGYQQGQVYGLVSSEPLSEGTSYFFDHRQTSYLKENRYEDYVACFVQGTRIATDTGEVPVQDLCAGDRIALRDGGYATLRLPMKRSVSEAELKGNAKLRPVRITAGALGVGLPKRDLVVSPQHRMLSNSPVCARMFDVDEVFVSAKKLTALPGVYVDHSIPDLTYYHLLFEAHEVIFAEGAPTESFYCGLNAMASLSEAARAELVTLFPELKQKSDRSEMARFTPPEKLQKQLVQRHQKNEKSVLV